MKKRAFAFGVVACVLGSAVFVACGGDDGSTEADGGSTPDASDLDSATVVDGSSSDVVANDAADARVDGEAGVTALEVTGYRLLGEVAFPFASPYALAVDSKNHLYVSEQTDAPDTHTLYLTSRSFASDIAPGHARVIELDAAGTYLGWIGRGADGTTGFHDAASVTQAVYNYDPGGFTMIRGMTFDAADHLYVLDNWRIQELDATKAFVRWAGYSFSAGYGWHAAGQPDSRTGPEIGGFTWPSGLRIHGGRFWVGTWFWNYPGFPNGQWNVVSALDTTTGLGVGWLGGANDPATAVKSTGYFATGGAVQPHASVAHTSSPGFFSSPRHFAWHGDRIYVVDNTSDPVLSIFDEKGVQQPGRLSHLGGVGSKPFAIAVDRHGNVIVSDMYTGSVRFFSHRIEASGELHQVAQWQVDTPSTPNATYPIIADFAWGGGDVLYVAATTKNKVYRLELLY